MNGYLIPPGSRDNIRKSCAPSSIWTLNSLESEPVSASDVKEKEIPEMKRESNP